MIIHKTTIENIRHSLAHLLAMAVLKKYPSAKLGIGPAIENGFYYDFLFLKPINEKELEGLEKEIKSLISENLDFKREKLPAAKALKLFKDQPFKIELIKELRKNKEPISIYRAGDVFVDLCKGPHVKNTKEINPDAFNLDRIAGAYWKGDEKNPQLQRVYGLAFQTKKELDEFLKLKEEAEKRDHKKLGQRLELFMFHETAPGMPYWLPKGVIMYNELINFWRDEHRARGYLEIISPLLNKKELYVASGHYEHYWENMFVSKTEEGEEYGVKSMNCPNAHVVFASKPRSYRELPLRLSDTDTLHRFELSGTLNGLLRVREFRQDDAHIYISENQIESEYQEVFKIVERFYSIFGMKYSFRLGTRPKSFMGDVKTWNRAENILEKILKSSGIDYFVEKGDGAFYGPKVDILMKDALGRDWQMGTIQLDFQQPRRFKLEYTDTDGKRKTPIAIHRVIYGSLERFIGILIEHFAGALPLWLAPVQAEIINVGAGQRAYGRKAYETLNAAGVRANLSDENLTVGKRIRDAEIQKIPYILVVGEKEEKNKTVNVRHYRRGQEGEMETGAVIEKIKREIEKKII